MSREEFFGRPIGEGTDDFEFDLCEVCQRRSPTWLEMQNQDNKEIIRFTCSDCHNEYINQKGVETPTTTREIEENEEIEEATRPGWIDDFISESENTIQFVGKEAATLDNEENAENIDNTTTDDESPPSFDETQFSEPPESFTKPDIKEEEAIFEPRQIAQWAPKFIQEALFGPNPEAWVEGTGGFEKDNLDLTLTTLGSFAGHDVSSVKLSAIQCLLALFNRNPQVKEQVLAELMIYLQDSDDTIVECAQQTIDQIQ